MLPATWRNLVINDIVEQLGLPIVSLTAKCESTVVNVKQASDEDQKVEESNMYRLGQPWATVHGMAASVQRTSRRLLPYPGSQLPDVFGEPGLVLQPIVLAAYQSLQDDVGIRRSNLLDVQAFLQVEAQAAYEFLSTPDGRSLWQHCTPELANAVLTRQQFKKKDNHSGQSIASLRKAYFDHIKSQFPRAEHTATVSLIWGVLVESALLNQRLIEDMRQTATANGCECMVGPEDWPDFYMPDPSPEAREAFNRYVHCRWPIHVFALDPVTDDQNVGDAFDRRRELQLAIAVAVAKGEISAQAAMKYVRSMETEIQTIT